MLVNNVDGEQKVSSMLKNSSFYIEVAKFVQAYTTIIKNPNEFLQMAKLQTLVSESDKLSWEQLVKIMVEHDMAKVAADTMASKVRTNLAEYLEKGIVK